MTDDQIKHLCGRLRAACAEALPCDMSDILEALAMVSAEIAHDWPKAGCVRTEDVLAVYHARSLRYAAKMATAAAHAGRH